MEQEQSQRGYGGRWKRWLVIYAVAAIVVYLVVYLVFFRDTGYGGGGGGGTGGGGSSGGGTGGGAGGYFVLALPMIQVGLHRIRRMAGRR